MMPCPPEREKMARFLPRIGGKLNPFPALISSRKVKTRVTPYCLKAALTSLSSLERAAVWDFAISALAWLVFDL